MNDDLILAVETSSLRGSVALVRGEQVLAEHALSADRRHAAELFPTIADMLQASGQRLADVTLLAFSRGPGSFTGLRIAATIGRMMLSAVGCRVAAVPTLEVIAHNSLNHPEHPSRLAVILDAKRGQVFGGLFERRSDRLETVGEAVLAETEAWLAGLEKPVWILGEGLARHADAVAAAGCVSLAEEYWTPRAATVAAIGRRMGAAGELCQPEDIRPFYIRPPECEEVYEQRRTAARQKRGE